MATRRNRTNRVKRLRTYNVSEAAKAAGVTTGTVRGWLKQGLRVVKGTYPRIIRGQDPNEFLQQRVKARKNPSGPGRMYCFKCKEPKRPAYGEVDFRPDGPVLGTLIGLCPDCATVMQRRSSRARLQSAVGDLRLSIQQDQTHLNEPSKSRCNHYSEED